MFLQRKFNNEFVCAFFGTSEIKKDKVVLLYVSFTLEKLNFLVIYLCQIPKN